jgi:thiamine monophosphate synthase
VHDASELPDAAEGGANYAFAGTVYATPSHPDRPGFGLNGLLAMVTAARSLPIIGIGGMTIANAADVIEVGGYGVAVVRGVWEARDPAGAVRGYLDSLAAAGAGGAEGGGGAAGAGPPMRPFQTL